MLVAIELRSYELNQAVVRSTQVRDGPPTARMAPLHLVKLSIRVTERHQFTLLKTGVLNTDRSEFPMQHPLKLRDRPPKLVTVAELVG